MGNISGACRSFIQYRMSFWRGSSWASSRSVNAKPSRGGGGDGEAFPALATKSAWFNEGGVPISQSVSRLDSMAFFFLLEVAGECRSGKPIAHWGRSLYMSHLRARSQYPCSLTINYEEQEQANKVSSGMSVIEYRRRVYGRCSIHLRRVSNGLCRRMRK